MPNLEMSEQEIVDYLKRTSLPTILVEGSDDAAIYRYLESRIGVFNGNVLPCTGRLKLLSIFERKEEFKNKKVVWLADLDMWVFSGAPPEYSEIIFTTGYSIENDLYAGGSIEDLLLSDERSSHSTLIGAVCKWFAFEVGEHLASRVCLINVHINQVIDHSINDLLRSYVTTRGFVPPDASLEQQISSNYKLMLRGKNLFQSLVHYLSSPNRNPKYGYALITDICLKLYSANPHIERLVTEIQKKLA